MSDSGGEVKAATALVADYTLPPGLAALLEASPDIQILLSPDQTILFANAAFRAVTPDEAGPLVGQPMSASLLGRDAGRAAGRRIVLDAVRQALRTRAVVQPPVFRYDVQKEPTDPPQETWWSLSAAPFDMEGRPRLLLTSRDVTAARAGRRGPVPDTAAPREPALGDSLIWAERRRLSQMFDQAPDLMSLLIGPDHVFELVNPALKRVAGPMQLLGRSLRDIVQSEQGRGVLARLDAVRADGRPFTARALPIRMMTARGIEDRFLDLTLQPLTDDDGRVEAVFCRGQDVTEQVRAQAAQRFLREELAHRQGNILAVVLALAEQSAARAASLEAFKAAFAARLSALSAIHSLLNSDGPDLPIPSLLHAVARSARRREPVLRGAAPPVSPRSAISLGLLFHELFQVSAGCEATPSTSVRIRAHSDARRVRLVWKARAAVDPWTDGDDFGRRLIDHAIRHEFRGEWMIRRREKALTACFQFPRDHPAWAPPGVIA